MVRAGNAPAASLLAGEAGPRRQAYSPPSKGEHFGVFSTHGGPVLRRSIIHVVRPPLNVAHASGPALDVVKAGPAGATTPALVPGPPHEHAGARVASHRPGNALPRGGPGAALDATADVVQLCPRVVV